VIGAGHHRFSIGTITVTAVGRPYRFRSSGEWPESALS
jgi:hypothetical protein